MINSEDPLRQTAPYNSSHASRFFSNHINWLLPTCGTLLGLILIMITGLSSDLGSNQSIPEQPISLFVALMMLAGGIYTVVALGCHRIPASDNLRKWIIFFAVMLRLTMMVGTPILEDDHYRYLWDGALVAHGHNPYLHAPSDIRAGAAHDNNSALNKLARQSGTIIERINYPWLRTIYPPMAQAAFGIAHHLSPWQVWSLRLIMAVFELAALILLCHLGVSTIGLLIYGWNPLLIKEVYNSVHVDALMLPFLLVAIISAQRDRPIVATAAASFATGIKLWPMLLMPIIWRRLTNRPWVLLASIMLFAACTAATLFPFVLSGLNWQSGLMAYGRHWEMNDALYMVITWIVDGITGPFQMPPEMANLMPRVVAAIVILGGTGFIAYQRQIALEQKFLMVATLLFMLSPTQFPWYYLWLLPYIPLCPHPALVLYAALLPLYYVRPLFDHFGRTHVFDHGIVWLQHGPVIIWLIRDWILRHPEISRIDRNGKVP